jgi:hypothetical protein
MQADMLLWNKCASDTTNTCDRATRGVPECLPVMRNDASDNVDGPPNVDKHSIVQYLVAPTPVRQCLRLIHVTEIPQAIKVIQQLCRDFQRRCVLEIAFLCDKLVL